MTEATLPGGLAPFNFTPATEALGNLAQADFANFFGGGNDIGADSNTYNGVGSVLDGSLSSNSTLALLSGATDTTIPSDYVAVYDLAGGDSVTGSGNLAVFLQGGLSSGTSFNTGSGNDTIYAGSSDTITAGSGSNTVTGGVGRIIVDGRSGGDLRFVGGEGAVSVIGGTGNSVLFGSTGATASYLQGGVGNNTLVGGSGTGATTLGGGHNVVEFANGSGPTTLFAGNGTSLLVGVTGKGVELFSTNPLGNTGSALMGLNGAADTVIGGSGSSTILGGTGVDTYSFIANHAGGTETIYGLKEGDKIAFGNYAGNPIVSEVSKNGIDVIKLSDGTTINLEGIDHTLFKATS